MTRQRNTGHRTNVLWLGALVHRISGVLLAIFLPIHFLVLGLAIEGEVALNGFIRWTNTPLVKIAETGLLFVLTVHLLGGVRILVIENRPWRNGQKNLVTVTIVFATVVALVFLGRTL